MLYRKNIFKWEQGLRVLVGLGLSALPLYSTTEIPVIWVLSGLGFAATGVFGFCPACAMMGRKSPQPSKTSHG